MRGVVLGQGSYVTLVHITLMHSKFIPFRKYYVNCGDWVTND